MDIPIPFRKHGVPERMVYMHRYSQPGFASAKKQRKAYVVKDDQVDTAMHRIKGTFEKHNGSINAVNMKDLLCFMERHVYNRDRQLGDRKKGHFRKVLVAALKKLIELKEIVFDPERFQYLLNYRFKQHRPHRQKYPTRKLAMRAA